MKAFEVFINGHRFCLAGVGNDGVLNAIINWVGGPAREDELFLHVGGLDCSTDEHLRWKATTIGVGAEILIKVVEAPFVDLPDERIRSERPTTVQQYRECLRQFSEQMTADERRLLLRQLVADMEH